MLNFEVSNFFDPGQNLAFSIRSARNRAPFDFATGVFLAPGATPARPTCPMTEMAAPYGCAYLGSYPTSSSVFWEDRYIVTVHDLGTQKTPDGMTPPPPRVLFSLAVPFAHGNSAYSSPPLNSF